MAVIEITKEIEELLQAVRRENPTMSDSEIVKHALAEYRQHELWKRRRAWLEALPSLEIPDEEARSIAAARQDDFIEMSIEELERYAESADEADEA